ncbi:MAG: alcohol dehydrogenase [Nitrososphaeraceae archaeon]|nr:alcohol dehydrogenase [Nitrososphaeraceae archaeon]MDW0176927.1 alcohol dehydrogenase [Nitrososphaeraceae archaeon]MDW0179727.1 alcohol dehydrogenase [Nitrososphaeraceae archaeon]MDW0190189.1 alcohol dehydrogenase [Nitrososphaeraceae archaeon]MDW0205424.1 alcohol dehydrogenase [Nitrososphaeraceae archaeon]
MKAARIIKPKDSLQVQDLDIPKATGSQVVVKVRSSGVCHSDIHLWEGGYEGIEGQFLKASDRGVTYPLTPGHEIAGIIESLGEEAEKEAIDKNDKVIVYPWIGEGLCPACRVGEENLCDKPRSLGVYTEGGYAEYVLVPSYKYLVKIGDLDTDVASTLSCSALTAYGAVKNAKLKPNDNVVIVGAGGGLGLMAVQLAKAVTGARIIALDLDQEKLKVAKENGADEIVSPKEGDPAKRVMEITENLGADAIIDFVNASKTVETDMKMLRRRGRAVLVGLFGGELKLSLVSMPTRAYRLIGSYTGSLSELIELVSLAKRGVIEPVVSHRFKLSQATEALQMLKDGKILGRGVINP